MVCATGSEEYLWRFFTSSTYDLHNRRTETGRIKGLLETERREEEREQKWSQSAIWSFLSQVIRYCCLQHENTASESIG